MNHKLVMFTTLLAVVYVAALARAHSSSYSESLHVTPLPHDSLLASFSFRSTTSRASFESQNFQFFPRALGQILQHAQTREMHVRFSSGRWDTEDWGERPWQGSREGGTGVELWAWVAAEGDAEASARWLTLTNALSGLFCASLNFVDETRTIRPILALSAEGQRTNSSSEGLHLLHGSLPNEVICTENLTPFLKLLPCKGKAGMSSLLDGHKLFDALWQTMAIDVRPSYLDNEEVVEMEQTIDLVLNIDRAKRARDDPIPRPSLLEDMSCESLKPYGHLSDVCFPGASSTTPQFSISQVFGRSIRGACPLTNATASDSATLCLNLPLERQITVVSKGPYLQQLEGNTTCFVLPVGVEFDLDVEASSLVLNSAHYDGITVERTLTGHGQQYGGVQTSLRNPSRTTSARFVYLESLPWYMKPYFHTLRSSLIPASNDVSCGQQDGVSDVFYRPAVDRLRASHLEIVMNIPPLCKLDLSYDFEKSILRYTEYPPDANRGFEVAPAIIRLLPSFPLDGDSGSRDKSGFIRTTSLLLYLATPDFSMPYNTIILTSTVLALAFGSIYNILVRRFVDSNEVLHSPPLSELLPRTISMFSNGISTKWKTR